MKIISRVFLILSFLSLSFVSLAAEINLAKYGQSSYKIVIAEDAEPAVKFAAEELAFFLKEISSAEFAVLDDSSPASDFEFLLGETKRNLPQAESLKPEVIEGYALLIQGNKLQIKGYGPRATLYGVYDFLEQDLGIRFLAFDYTHIPKQQILSVNLSSRKYDPPLDYRNIISCSDAGTLESRWALRSRLNSVWGYAPMGSLVGGFRHVGGFVHNLPALMPHKKYFDEHPEYYALVKGERQRMAGRFPSHPCLSNPAVKEIVITSIKEKINVFQKKQNFADDQLFFPVEYTDHDQICECENCQEINKAEETDGGTLYRFLNAISDELSEEYPTLILTTLAYGATLKPPKNNLRKNIVIRYAPIRADFAKALDDPSSESNAFSMSCLEGWKKSGTGLYVWYYAGNFNDGITPHPDLKGLKLNFDILLDCGMKGMFVETVQNAGIELKELRSYILAQKLWRPETDLDEAIEEFCNLYYGQGGKYALKYLDYLHDWYYNVVNKDNNNPLTLRGAPPYSHAYTREFLDKADEILYAAAGAAETELEKLHVSVMHMPIWYLRLLDAMNTERRVEAFPVEWRFKTDPEKSIKASDNSANWGEIRIDDFWTKQDAGKDYHGVAWYAVNFTVQEQFASSLLSLYFASVDGYVDAYIDGKKVGEQKEAPGKMWNKGFYIHLPEKLATGEHELKVRVEKDTSAAGIWQEVGLMNLAQELSAYTRYIAKRYVDADLGFVPVRRKKAFRESFMQRLETLLEAKTLPPPDIIKSGSITKNASTMRSSHKTYDIIDDSTAFSGKCARQVANKRWTLGQAISWRVGDHLEKNHDQSYKLRIRLKVNKKSDKGEAFRVGFYYQNKNWSGGSCTPADTIKAADIKDGEWFWYEYPHPLKYKKYERSQLVSVFAADNQENIEDVCVDQYEIYPID